MDLTLDKIIDFNENNDTPQPPEHEKFNSLLVQSKEPYKWRSQITPESLLKENIDPALEVKVDGHELWCRISQTKQQFSDDTLRFLVGAKDTVNIHHSINKRSEQFKRLEQAYDNLEGL